MIPKLSLLFTGSVLAVDMKTKSKSQSAMTAVQEPGQSALLQATGLVPQYPADILKCFQEKKVMQTQLFSKQQYEDLAKQVIDHQHSSEDKNKYAACIMRLEGHDLMDYRKEKNKKGQVMKDAPGTGGSDGCVNFNEAQNAVLPSCLAWTDIQQVYEKWCDKISLADFMVLASEAVIGSMAVGYDPHDQFKEDTLLQKFRDQFEYGRKTSESCPNNTGLIVNPEKGCNDLQEVFINNVFNTGIDKKSSWGLTAALQGLILRSAKSDGVGFDGLWGDPQNQAIFNNEYFKTIMLHGWGPVRTIGGDLANNQWTIVDKSIDTDKKRSVMLNTDMCLFFQDNHEHSKCMQEQHDGRIRNRNYCKKFENKGKFMSSKESSCCAWTNFKLLEKRGILKDQEYCGMELEEMIDYRKVEKQLDRKEGFKQDQELIRESCCKDEYLGSFGDCDSQNWPRGPAMVTMLEYANSNDEYYRAYLEAWKTATENGWKLNKLL